MLVLVVALAAQPAAASAIGACDAQKRLDARKVRHMPDGRPPFAIGDSMMLGAADALAHAGIKVDARGCRQMSAGLGILSARARRHRLPRVVIVALGSNWIVTRAQLRRALRVVDDRFLVLVTPPHDADARRMRRFARRHRGQVCVADWAARASAHPAWAPGDGIHLSLSGRSAFVRLLKPYRRVTKHHPGACGGS